MKYIILIILVLLILSCSLKRTNPLDPLVSGTEDPNRVTNIEVVTAGNNTINITWDTMINIDGYYIYRSYGSNNLYELIKDEGDISVHEYFDNDVEDISNVWYIMSAYIVVDSAKLEGYRSEPTTWTQ
ncbi:MAG: hypothetical protein P9M11_08575 [Candidatus Tenebribacter burtonii]|nr:hypothetical protein [Candidatus Tenebribacter burtonii]